MQNVLSPERKNSHEIVAEAPALKLRGEDIDATIANQKMITERMKTELVDGEDFTTKLFPGQKKPQLLDPGAAKIRGWFKVYPDAQVLLHEAKLEEGEEHIRYVVSAPLLHYSGMRVGGGVGSANSSEVKYKYRWVPEGELRSTYGYRDDDLQRHRKEQRGNRTVYYVPNPEILDLDNTLLKMAAKRAEVDATMGLPGVAAVFGQGLKTPEKQEEEKSPPREEPSSPPVLQSPASSPVQAPLQHDLSLWKELGDENDLYGSINVSGSYAEIVPVSPVKYDQGCIKRPLMEALETKKQNVSTFSYKVEVQDGMLQRILLFGVTDDILKEFIAPAKWAFEKALTKTVP